MPVCSECGAAYVPDDAHTCPRGTGQSVPARSRYIAAVLLIAGVTLGFFPLIRATGTFVFAIMAMVLLWLGVPALVHKLLGREARWFAIAANVCPPLSVAVWPDPHNPK